ncbi:MAG: amidohydrolase family protein [Clostridia bacterium]|nr:amidohydrolase family protein [Clostridia bacterium]
MMMDYILRGGTVVDGSGEKGYAADVAIKGDTIAMVGDLSGIRAEHELDVRGLVVAPGFIDAHSHSDLSFLQDDSHASKLYQGITTEVTGQCGDSPFPACAGEEMPGAWNCASFEELVRRFEEDGHKMAVHQAIMLGHGSLRAHVVGYEDRAATGAELEKMKQLLDREMQSGVFGLSMGLEYAPGFFADQRELNELGSVVEKHQGVVTCHMRDEGLGINEALEELMAVNRFSGVHVHVSHLKLDHHQAHGRAQSVWKKILQARDSGVRITADMYPFTASCTGLSIRCPKWSLDGGDEALLAHLRGDRRQEVIEGIRTHYFDAEQAETCLFCDDGGMWPEIAGKTLRFVAEEFLHTQDYAWAAAEVLLRTKARINCIFFVMSEQDMKYFLMQDVMIGSDGWAFSGDPEKVKSKPHPRSFGSAAEFLRICREEKLCPLEKAVHRMTGMVADMLGICDRGRLAEGMKADIAVFDADSIKPRSTYLNPVQLAQGVSHVFVDGAPALLYGSQTANRNGKFLRKNI